MSRSGSGAEKRIARLYRVIDSSISLLESRMIDDGSDPETRPERDMRALGNIVRSLEKLKDLEPGNGKPNSEQPKAGHAATPLEQEDRLRTRIVERILKLRERSGNPRGGR
ncbi:MAG: hypothetical protein AB7O43_12280 [Hyphomicrobiaceae bacterium]